MSKKICYIIAAGDIHEESIAPEHGAVVIAADAGLLQAKKLGIKPDIIIGDMDSAGNAGSKANVANEADAETILLPTVKDDTDTLAAARLGLERGFRVFHIYGGLGGERVDHSLANIQTLIYISKNKAHGYLYGENQVITAITDEEIIFPADMTGYLSIFSLCGDALGVNESGLKYTLSNATITPDFPIGVSNEFIPGKEARISIEKGTLVIIYPKGRG